MSVRNVLTPVTNTTGAKLYNDRSHCRTSSVSRAKRNVRNDFQNSSCTIIVALFSLRQNLFPQDSVQARMMSARRNRINILNNQLCEVQMKLEEVTKENRVLKNLQHRQVC